MKNYLSTLEQTRAEGKAEGQSQGKAEGQAEGQAEGRADLLLRQLRKRFGDAVTASVAMKLRAATIDELDQYGEQLLDAQVLEDVFGAS